MYPTKLFYITLLSIALILAAAFLIDALFYAGQLLLLLFVVATAVDCRLLYKYKQGISCSRNCAQRFSNGDENEVRLYVTNHYPHPIHLEVVDEIPVVFQKRDVSFRLSLLRGESKTILYTLSPTKRGSYDFGVTRIFAQTRIGLIARRHSLGKPQTICVYPSYLMLRQYELLAISNNLTELGIKRIRRIGHHSEFEQIKEYVKGDDLRIINHNATARRHQLMVNTYQDERSQQIYCIIDKGRLMQAAFNGMTLLDYAINAALVVSYVAIRKQDKAGLATFEGKFDTFLPASNRSAQMQHILEALYRQQTTFGESDYSSLYVHLNKYINKRSLLIIYTNMDSVAGMERQINYLRRLARQHVVLVVFFLDVEMEQLAATPPKTTYDYFSQTAAEKFLFEKRLVAGKLKQYGVHTLLTSPQALSIDIINKYLELKARRII